jgi:chromosome segregation protein
MISRVIEARPEELRGFIEEAAGISKYKERRRETENRISHTKENLERLNDLREEVDKQLRHLQRQAATARRYQALKTDERKLTAELLALRLRDIDSDSQSKEGILRERDTALQSALADLRAIESSIETTREHFTEKSEALNQVQGRFYQVGADVSRIEQSIAHARDLRQRQTTDLAQAEQGLVEVNLHLNRDQAQIDQLAVELETLAPDLDVVRAREQASSAAFEQAEEAMQEWQESWDEFNRDARAASEKTQVERARIEQLENQLRRLVAQRERTLTEIDATAPGEIEAQIAALSEDVEASQEQEQQASERLRELNGQIQSLRERERELVSQNDQCRRELQDAQGRLLSLQALQQAALGVAQGKVAEWLNTNALEGRPRLAQQLNVEAGWERAVETVLGSYLEAVCVDTIDSVAGLLESLQVGTVTFFASSNNAAGAAGDRLSGRVQGPAGVASLLGGIIAVDNLADALRMRDRLGVGESVITRDGIWIGHDWLRVSRDKDVHAGVIGREHEMRGLRDSVSAAEQRLAATESEVTEARNRLHELEEHREDAQSNVNQSHRAHSEVNAQLRSLRTRAEQMAERGRNLAGDAEELAMEVDRTQDSLAGARGRLDEGMEEMAVHDETRAELEARREHLRQNLGLARAQAQEDRTAAQQTAIAVESKRSAHTSILSGLERMRSQLQQFEQRRGELNRQLAVGEEPIAASEKDLEVQLELRAAVEQNLSEARRSLEDAEARMRELDERRMDVEGKVDESRQRLDDIRLATQELRVRRESLQEQFNATHFELAAVMAELPTEADAPAWEQTLREVTDKVDRLGQVNLAAIDEFKEQSERKEYLDRQYKDLTDALETLESAMQKIDKETRTRFQDTFDKVNAGIKERFPRLFGGGHAYLELAGEDVLSAGVAIMARPPGKRNSTINQLSGGEKALTAVALVFSIFELNPAPFCLLDEVDAPLDDNNVGRFCETVKEMSQRVQFIFITHNKTTMELAEQLIGVTMHEPGASRLVAVDVEEAVRLAAI